MAMSAGQSSISVMGGMIRIIMKLQDAYISGNCRSKKHIRVYGGHYIDNDFTNIQCSPIIAQSIFSNTLTTETSYFTFLFCLVQSLIHNVLPWSVSVKFSCIKMGNDYIMHVMKWIRSNMEYRYNHPFPLFILIYLTAYSSPLYHSCIYSLIICPSFIYELLGAICLYLL